MISFPESCKLSGKDDSGIKIRGTFGLVTETGVDTKMRL